MKKTVVTILLTAIITCAATSALWYGFTCIRTVTNRIWVKGSIVSPVQASVRSVSLDLHKGNLQSAQRTLQILDDGLSQLAQGEIETVSLSDMLNAIGEIESINTNTPNKSMHGTREELARP